MWLNLGLLILLAANTNTQATTMDDKVNIPQQYKSNIGEVITDSANVTLQNSPSFVQLKHASERIYGGKEAKRNAYPSIVALFYGKQHLCGGTILTQWHVLTAAHCVKEEGAIHQIQRAVIHKSYKEVDRGYDIALLVTKQRMKYNSKVSRACLLRLPPPIRAVVKAVGWGRTSDKVISSEVLMEADLKMVPYRACIKKWGHGTFPFEGSVICTFHKTRDSCQGDSGGPIYYNSPTAGTHLLVGLVSFGGTTCAGTVPAVNTAVAAFIEWITSNVHSK